MTPEELWRKVGRLLRDAREHRRWKYPSDVEKHSGPTYKTVQNHENGDIKSVSALNQHAEALGMTLVDVLRSALIETEKKISPEAAQILRVFEQTDLAGRQAFLHVAQAVWLPERKP